jgi:branched-chain amino acid transport system substrate-binding protein
MNTEDPEVAKMIEELCADVAAPNKFFLGYDIVGAIAQSVAAVGTDPVALQGALENLNYEGITCDIVIDPATHMPTDCFMFMYTYDNQTPVMLQQFAG